MNHDMLPAGDGVPGRKSISMFRDKIIRWFRYNERSYPWRDTDDPFRLLVAEMMLRRTKADQVKSVYEQLFGEFPDVKAMAEAKQNKLEEILHPLGLQWRIPAFLLVARELKEKYQCKVPETREKLTALPGVGDYVAGAVLSIAFKKKEWIVDSNVVRVFKRYFGIETSKEGRRDRHIIDMARRYASGRDPRTANLAILDFAALVCIPGSPGCHSCPLGTKCQYAVS